MSDPVAKREFLYLTIASQAFRIKELREALEKIVVGWSDITEEDGTEIPFTKANLKDFSEDVDFVAGVVEAFQKFYTTGKEGN